MKVLFEFGYPGIKREVNWWQSFEDIPHIMKFQDKVWSAAVYDTGKLGTGIDYHYIFTPHHDQAVWAAPLFETLFNVPELKCECGSIYTSSKDHHMYFCPKSEKK